MATRTKTQRDSRARSDSHGDGRLIETHNDISAENRVKLVKLLNAELADVFDLFSQTKQAHWNVKGPQFIQLHKLYDELAEILLGHVDTIAERATALGGVATGTVRMATNASRLPEFSAGPVGSMESVKLLVERYAAVAETARQAIDTSEKLEDMDTSDLFIDLSRDLDKGMWFLEAHLQPNE